MSNAYFYTYNVVFDAPVSVGAKLVYAYLCKCADKDGKSYPSHKAIAVAAGIGVTTVKKAISELEAAGLIAVQGQARPDRGRRANIYIIMKERTNGFFLTYDNVFAGTLTAKARLVYLYFCRLASGRDQAFPAHKTTAKACGLSVAGARTAIDELEAAGLIKRQAQYRDNGGQRSNHYTLIIETDDKADITEPLNTNNNGTDDSSDAMYKDGEPLITDAENASVPTERSDYSSSNCISLISGKSSSLESVIPKPCEIRCSVRKPGLFVWPLMILSMVDCFIPDSVASLLTVISRSLHKYKILFDMACEYVMVSTSFLTEYG